jgi:hypothetical protein
MGGVGLRHATLGELGGRRVGPQGLARGAAARDKSLVRACPRRVPLMSLPGAARLSPAWIGLGQRVRTSAAQERRVSAGS